MSPLKAGGYGCFQIQCDQRIKEIITLSLYLSWRTSVGEIQRGVNREGKNYVGSETTPHISQGKGASFRPIL
jgi:hypothetical protein